MYGFKGSKKLKPINLLSSSTQLKQEAKKDEARDEKKTVKTEEATSKVENVKTEEVRREGRENTHTTEPKNHREDEAIEENI
jgi:hypothetical protein